MSGFPANAQRCIVATIIWIAKEWLHAVAVGGAFRLDVLTAPQLLSDCRGVILGLWCLRGLGTLLGLQALEWLPSELSNRPANGAFLTR